MNASKYTLSILVLGLGGLLTSCVDPYYGGATASHTTVTQYRPGYVTHTLPPRYEVEVIGGTRYYRHDNVYYRPQGSRYVVVEAPRGSHGWTDRRPYDRRDSRDTRVVDRRDVRVVDRRDVRPYDRRDTRVVTTLPRGARMFTHRGTPYYTYENRYYRSQGDAYVIVESPF